jgi:hypothetical protein
VIAGRWNMSTRTVRLLRHQLPPRGPRSGCPGRHVRAAGHPKIMSVYAEIAAQKSFRFFSDVADFRSVRADSGALWLRAAAVPTGLLTIPSWPPSICRTWESRSLANLRWANGGIARSCR